MGSAALASLVGLLAARLLGPGDFGLVGVALLVVSVVEALTQLGFERALVQRRGDIEPLLATAWTWQVARGVLLALLLALAAPWFAAWYGEPTLSSVMLALALVPLLRSSVNPRAAALTRALQFERQFGLRLWHAAGSAALAIVALLVLRDVRALYLRALIEALLAALLSFALVPWRPRLAWDAGAARELWRWGRWVSPSAFMVFAITRGDDLFVSRFLGLHALGVYQLAYLVTNLPATHVSHLLAKAAFPVLSRLQDDPPALRRAFIGVLVPVLFVSLPFCALVILEGDGLVQLALGPGWSEVGPLLPILALAGLLRALAGTGGALFQALGRPELELVQNLPRFAILAAGIWPAAANYGLRGVCGVVLVSLLPAVGVWAVLVPRLLGLGRRQLLAVGIRPLLVAGLLAAALVGARRVMPQTAAGTVLVWSSAVVAWLLSLVAADKLFGWRTMDRVASLIALRKGG
jgi:O-antigen/teichoic acid export membrane protein